MLKIKLSRVGKKGQSSYRVVVIEGKSRRDGRCVELLGTYNPRTNPATVKLDKKRYLYWQEKGAQPTETVSEIFKKA